MYPRTNYEMTEEELRTILDACKPVACMMIGGTTPPSQQENANRAWASLGKKMGFDADTVQPTQGKGNRFFSAVPSETKKQREERVAAQKESERVSEMAQLEKEIGDRKKRLTELRDCKGIELGDGNYSGCTGLGGDCPRCGE